MNKIFKLSLLFAAFFIINNGCKKSSNNPSLLLPAATTEGKNTFGCLIDNIPFTYNASNSNQRMVASISQLNSNFYLSIAVSEINNTSVSIGSTNNTPFEVKENIIVNSGHYPTAFGQVYLSELLYSSNNIRDITSSSEGEINYTRIDTINKIISGTFWFDAYDTSGLKIIRITDGRFDLKY